MKKHNLIIIFLLIALQLAAKTPIESFVNNPLLENANISLLVKDIETNQILSQYNPKNSITPASTMKIVTTATALEMLGPDFYFETKLEIDGIISANGTLNGNIYIRGGGDPTLGSMKLGDNDFLSKWVAAVKKVGINKITGRIVADASLFDDEGVNPKWSWEDIGNYYAAGAYGISYMDNTFRLVLQSGVIGTTPQILRVIPEISGLSFDNRLTSSTIKTDSAYFYGAPHSNSRYILGEIPANKDEFIIKGDIPNPGLLLAKHFHDKLIGSGLIISQLPTDKYVPATSHTEIYVHDSPPLSEIITEINIHSNNHYAEHVFRYLSLKNNLIGTTSGAIQVIKLFWKSKGMPVDQLFMCDGSGLSPSNAVSAQFYVDLLTYMKTKSTNKNIFYNSLPISGESGTLSTVLVNTVLQGKVHAKSGTISRVKGYVGYIYANYRTYVFAIMVNNPNGSSKSVVQKIEEFLLSVSAE